MTTKKSATTTLAAAEAAITKKPAEAGVAGERLKSYIERAERLLEEKSGIAADIKEVYAEARGTGFDTKIIKKIIRLRKMDRADRAEAEQLMATYLAALGMDAVATAA